MTDIQDRPRHRARFDLQSERLGPLPLVNHFIERIGLEDALHRHVPSDARCAVPHARALGVLLRSIIVEREPIYRQQETVHGFASGMFGISAQEMTHLSDDRLGRALDRLFDADRAALLTDVVLAVAERFDIQWSTDEDAVAYDHKSDGMYPSCRARHDGYYAARRIMPRHRRFLLRNLEALCTGA